MTIIKQEHYEQIMRVVDTVEVQSTRQDEYHADVHRMKDANVLLSRFSYRVCIQGRWVDDVVECRLEVV